MTPLLDISLLFLSFSALLAAAAAWSLTVVYNLCFHPLSGFPGPKLAAASGWYATYYEVYMDGALVDHLAELHRIYGSVVRFGPNELHFRSFKAYTDIYHKGIKFKKDPKFYDRLDESESSLCFIDPDAARARREILAPAFSRRAILQLESLVFAKVEELLDRLLQYEHADVPVHIHRALRSFSADVIISYCFARDPHMLDAPGFAHPWVLKQELLYPKVLLLKNFSWFFAALMMFARGVNLLNTLFGKAVVDDKHALFVTGLSKHSQQIDELLSDPSRLDHEAHETVFHYLLNPRSVKGPAGPLPSRKSLNDEASALLGAGADTVTGATACGLSFVLQDPAILTKLVAELDAAWDEHGVIALRHLEKLPYLTSVIKESLRLSHGLVLPAPRVVHPTNAVIDGHVVPAGTVVACGQTFIHYDPDIFPEPYRFQPERWLGSDTARLDQHLIAFGRGPRSCLGINLAWCELYLLFGNILRTRDLVVAPGTTPDYGNFKCHFIPTVPEDKLLRCLVKRRRM